MYTPPEGTVIRHTTKEHGCTGEPDSERTDSSCDGLLKGNDIIAYLVCKVAGNRLGCGWISQAESLAGLTRLSVWEKWTLEGKVFSQT